MGVFNGRLLTTCVALLGFILLLSIVFKKKFAENAAMPASTTADGRVLGEIQQLRTDLSVRDEQLLNYEAQMTSVTDDQQRLSSNVHALADHVWLQSAVAQENVYRHRNGESPIVLDKYWQPNQPFKYLDMNRYQSRMDRIKARVYANNE